MSQAGARSQSETNPHFNSETTETAWHVINDFIIPELIGKSIRTASDIPNLIAPIRGHQMAKAGVENAFWDIEAQQKNLPLWNCSAGRKLKLLAESRSASANRLKRWCAGSKRS